MSKQITNIKATSDKAKSHEVKASSFGSYLVTSATSGNVYRTRLSPVASCTCDWANWQPADMPVACSHVQATLAYTENKKGYSVKIRASHDNTKHLHRRTINIGNGVKATARKVKNELLQMSGNELNDLLFG